MSLNYLERTAIVTSLVGCAAFSVWFTMRPKVRASKDSVSNVRQELLKQKNIRMLYSTMSFFYLQGFEQSKIDSFYRMKEILKIDRPSTVVLDLSQEEHDRSYVKVMSHPMFKQSIEKLDYLLEHKKEEDILSMKQFDLQNLEKLYLLNYCTKNRCKIIFAQESEDYYNQLENNYKELVKQGIYPQRPQEVREMNYVEKAMNVLKPATGWRIFLPSAPFKTIYGVVDPRLVDGVAQKWKQKFRTDYGHNVIEDEAIVEREKQLLEAKKFGHY